MSLQDYLVSKFESWRPLPPQVEGRSKNDVTLFWEATPFHFLKEDLLYWVQKKEKLPPWVGVYSGGKTSKRIDNLPPRHPHKFRFKVILKATAVSMLADKALKHFGDEVTIRNALESYEAVEKERKDIHAVKNDDKVVAATNDGDNDKILDKYKDTVTELNALRNVAEGDRHTKEEKYQSNMEQNVGSGDMTNDKIVEITTHTASPVNKKWIESQWSEETMTSTDTDGSSAVCFCMAVRCGYLKQVQGMLDERPALLEIINTSNGFTPLATAVRKGDVNTVKFLLAAGADPNAASTSGQTPLHLATLGARVDLVELLLDKGADFQARDLNGLRIEHYAVESGSCEMLKHILMKGGDVHARDFTGWSPLFRAVIQGASTALIELLVEAGSDVNTADYVGLTLTSAARLLTNRQYGSYYLDYKEDVGLIELLEEAGSNVNTADYAVLLTLAARLLTNSGRSRDSILRLVDSHFPHEQAVANFTRLTKKISSLHNVFK